MRTHRELVKDFEQLVEDWFRTTMGIIHDFLSQIRQNGEVTHGSAGFNRDK